MNGDDPHFRKASFIPAYCPSDCLHPCHDVCPTLAINEINGVISDLCYGCGRCLPSCPFNLISTSSYITNTKDIPSLLKALSPDSIELHTQSGRLKSFIERINQIQLSGIKINRLAISFGLTDASNQELSNNIISEFWARNSIIRQANFRPIWQLDGRPMSGDIGIGTSYSSIRLLKTLLPLIPPGPLQIAGGTNSQTLLLIAENFPIKSTITRPLAGVAFGGIARRLLQPLILKAEAMGFHLLEHPELRDEAVRLAYGLISPWRRR